MERLEHFRGARLLDGDRVVLESVSGHLSSRQRSKTRTEWFGYFELGDEQHIPPGSHYQLTLQDGRHAEIFAEDLQHSDVPGQHIHVAMFYVVGEIGGQRRIGLAH